MNIRRNRAGQVTNEIKWTPERAAETKADGEDMVKLQERTNKTANQASRVPNLKSPKRLITIILSTKSPRIWVQFR